MDNVENIRIPQIDYLHLEDPLHYIYGEEVSDHSESCFLEEVHKINYTPPPRCVWDLFMHQRTYAVISMQEPFVDQAVDFVMNHYAKYDLLCRGMHLTRNEEAVAHYRNLIRYWVQDRSSILAIEEGNERIVGILVAKMNYMPMPEKLEGRLSRLTTARKIYENKVYVKNKMHFVQVQVLGHEISRQKIENHRVQDIQNLRVRVRQKILDFLNVQLNVRKYYDIKLFCADRLETDYKDIEQRLITAMEEVAVILKTKYIIAIMNSKSEQKYFRKAGFTRCYEVNYRSLRRTDKTTDLEKYIFPCGDNKAKCIGFYKILDPVLAETYQTEIIEEEEESLLIEDEASDNVFYYDY